ncbi:MAG: hypothetical protein QMD88_00645 [Coprothermobacterota bacterium]|nr:hypothetical protein [Coprothermobacterota bacterium]
MKKIKSGIHGVSQKPVWPRDHKTLFFRYPDFPGKVCSQDFVHLDDQDEGEEAEERAHPSCPRRKIKGPPGKHFEKGQG